MNAYIPTCGQTWLNNSHRVMGLQIGCITHSILGAQKHLGVLWVPKEGMKVMWLHNDCRLCGTIVGETGMHANNAVFGIPAERNVIN